MSRHAGIEGAGNPLHPPGQVRGLCRRPAYCRDQGEELFFPHIHLQGGPALVRRYLPKLIEQLWERKINPGNVFNLHTPLDQVAEGYRAMDERRAIKTLPRP
ncbi:MAG: hypothetical protein WAL59_22055 [Roseiarcus sp.]